MLNKFFSSKDNYDNNQLAIKCCLIYKSDRVELIIKMTYMLNIPDYVTRRNWDLINHFCVRAAILALGKKKICKTKTDKKTATVTLFPKQVTLSGVVLTSEVIFSFFTNKRASTLCQSDRFSCSQNPAECSQSCQTCF